MKAQKDYKDMKDGLAKYKAEYGNKCSQEKIKWYEKQIQHLKRKADATGETHGRRGKGKR